MLVDWGSLPLLPLGCVLKYLCTKDALVASSVCRHWRSALLMFGARMDMLKLRVSHMEKSCFLTRVFRKQVKLIYIFMDSSEEDLKHFMSNVFTQFYDMKMIKEITFVGPIYLQEEYFSPVFMLKRETLDSLPFNNLESLNLMGCTISPLESVKEDEYTCLESECDPLALSFNNVLKPGKGVNLANATALSMIQILTIDYDFVDSDLVKRLSCLKQFHFLNIDVTDKSDIERKPLNWDKLNTFFPRGLKICVSMICVPQSKFPKVMSHVLVEEMPLTSMKVLFCKTFCLAMLKLLTYYYKDTLRELVWVDSPFDPVLDKEILLKEASDDALEVANMFDPLVLLCWQCSELQRLVLHGAYYKYKFLLVSELQVTIYI
ncbi:PREDICTED: uncharacterized protein LOC106110571 isoform X2 [Papilio polytes]|nr:PREDICTED: uncharacterized protein LOC106110571 isoform X2 [Papilio polytes]